MRARTSPARTRATRLAALGLGAFLCAGCATNRSLESTDGVTDWAQLRGDASRSGSRAVRDIDPPLYLSWRTKAGRSPVSEPSLAGDVLLVAGSDRHLRLLDIETGDTVWRIGLDGVPSTNVVVSGARAYVGHLRPESKLLALSVADGSVIWESRDVRAIGGSVASGDTLFAWDIGRGPVALDGTSGEEIWRAEIPGRWPAALTHAGGMLLAACELDSVWALSSRDGSMLWAAPGFEATLGAPAVAGGLVVVPGAGGTVRALRLDTGDPVWTRDLPGRLTSAACVDGREAYVASSAGRLYALDVTTGESLWNVELDGVSVTAPAVAGDVLVVVTMSGTCQLVSRSDRRVVHTVDLKRPVRVSPVVRGARLYAVDDGGTVYAYESS